MSSKDLRQRLVLDGLRVGEHQAVIEQLAAEFGHTILWLEFRHDETCVPYALGLTDVSEYRRIAYFDDVFAGKDFVQWLLARGKLTELLQPTLACLALYFDLEKWTHVGVVVQTDPVRVDSKWGEFPRYEHALLEVPSTYGTVVRYFEKPANALNLFLEYAGEKRSGSWC